MYVRDARGSTWTRAFPDAVDVTESAYASWLVDKTAWHYAPGDLDVKEVSLVYERAEARLFVTGMGAITAANLLKHRVDLVVSLEPLSQDAFREVVHAQRELPVKHLACPIRDQTPKYWGDKDLENAARGVQETLVAMRNGKRVLTHCLMGIHRSPAMATVVVAQLEDLALEEASRRVRSRRALAMNVPETTQGFVEALRVRV